MSLFVIATGTLIADPQPRSGKGGKSFVTATLRTSTEGEDEATLVSVIAFGRDVQGALMALRKGDAVSVTGRARLATWTGKDGALRSGLSVVAERAMSAYEVRKKRAATTKRDDEDWEMQP